MAEHTKNYEELIKDAELERLKAEISKTNAERRKIDVERVEIDKKVKRMVIEYVFKGFFFALIFFPLGWFYVTEVAIPLSKKENIQISLKHAKDQEELNRKIKIFQAENQQLKEEKAKGGAQALVDLKKLKDEYNELESLKKALSDQYKNLSTQVKLTQKQRDEYKNKYQSLQEDNVKHQKTIQELNQRIEDAKKNRDKADAELSNILRKISRVKEIKHYRSKWAILIGIDKYTKPLPALMYSVKDAKSIEELLEKNYGFRNQNIISLYNQNATLSNIKKVFSDLKTRIGPQDQLIIFWSGHGVIERTPSRKIGYLVPSDGNPKNPYPTCFPMTEFGKITQYVDSKDTLILLDACYGQMAIQFNYKTALFDNTDIHQEYELEYMPDGSVRSVPIGGSWHSNYKIASKSRAIITSGAEMVVEMTNLKSGVFTHSILKGLGQSLADFNRDGVITTYELFVFIRDDILRLTNGKQTPVYGGLPGDEGGEMQFIKSSPVTNSTSKKKSNVDGFPQF